MKLTPQGMQFGELADPSSRVVALLGGLAMPKSGIMAADVKDAIGKILEEDGRVIGLCYMDVFREHGWHNEIDFDCIINGTLTGYILRK